MSRIGALFWLTLVVMAGFATFKAKYAIQDIEDRLHRVRKQTIAEQQEIRVLTAEWTYLNQPERLAELNRRFFGLAPITARQLQVRIEDIPLRAPVAPEVLVAAAPEAAPPQGAPTVPAPVVPQRPPPAPFAAVMPAPATRPPVPIRLATAEPRSFGSLDALIAQIVQTR